MSGKGILITGGTGFLGRHVHSRLPEADAVGAIDGSVYEWSECLSLALERKPSTIIHLAAKVGGIGANQLQPSLMFDANAQMGLNAINVCWHVKSSICVVGTTCSYPAECSLPFLERDLFNGYPEETNAPYGIAKRSLLVFLKACREVDGLKFAYPILANLYGPGDKSDHCIPDIIEKIGTATEQELPEVTLWGDGTPTRDFLYVEDAADAVVLATERMDCEPINVGTGIETSIGDVAKKIADLFGYRGTIKWDRSKPNGQQRRKLDTGRAFARWKWRAKVGLDEGLARTVEAWKESRCASIS